MSNLPRPSFSGSRAASGSPQSDDTSLPADVRRALGTHGDDDDDATTASEDSDRSGGSSTKGSGSAG